MISQWTEPSWDAVVFYTTWQLPTVRKQSPSLSHVIRDASCRNCWTAESFFNVLMATFLSWYSPECTSTTRQSKSVYKNVAFSLPSHLRTLPFQLMARFSILVVLWPNQLLTTQPSVEETTNVKSILITTATNTTKQSLQCVLQSSVWRIWSANKPPTSYNHIATIERH